jgi:deoxyribonuclease I
LQPSASHSFSQSKKKLMKLYINANKTSTLYCGCSFNADKNIDSSTCGYVPRTTTNNRSRRLEWEHVMPAHTFGKNLQCWKEKICTKRNGKTYKGRKCCSRISGKFKTMAADMHNLFPSIGEINADRSNHLYGEVIDEPRVYGQCDFELERNTGGKGRIAEPRESIRGDIARAYFYMINQYDVPVPDDYEEMLNQWDLSDPTDQWERERNDLIEAVQGNRNQFVDDADVVNNTKDF